MHCPGCLLSYGTFLLGIRIPMKTKPFENVRFGCESLCAVSERCHSNAIDSDAKSEIRMNGNGPKDFHDPG